MTSKKGKSGKLQGWMKDNPRYTRIDRDELIAKHGKYFIHWLAYQEIDFILDWLIEEGFKIDKSSLAGASGVRKILTGQVS